MSIGLEISQFPTAQPLSGNEVVLMDQVQSGVLTTCTAPVSSIAAILGVNTVKQLTFTQITPSAVWYIVHGFGIFPAVSVVDSSNQQVFGSITYPDSNTVQITFSAPFSGVAYLV